MLQVRQTEVGRLQFFDFVAKKDFRPFRYRIGVAIRHGAPQLQLSGKRDLLGSAEADVGKVVVRVTRKRAGTTEGEVLNLELRIGQRRYLRGTIPRGLCGLLGRQNSRVILCRFLQ